MLKKIESLILTSDKYEDSISFFRDKLGLEMTHAVDNMSQFSLDGFPLFLARANGGSGVFISIETDDIEKDFEMMENNGIEFREPIKVFESGDKSAFFKGPAGSEFMLYQPEPADKNKDKT